MIAMTNTRMLVDLVMTRDTESLPFPPWTNTNTENCHDERDEERIFSALYDDSLASLGLEEPAHASHGLEAPFFQLCCCVSFWFWREIEFGCTYYYVFMYRTGFSQNVLVVHKWIHSGYIYY